MSCLNPDVEAEEDSHADQGQISSSVLDGSVFMKHRLENSSAGSHLARACEKALEKKREKSKLKFTPSKSWKDIERKRRFYKKISQGAFVLTKSRNPVVFTKDRKQDPHKPKKLAVSAYRYASDIRETECHNFERRFPSDRNEPNRSPKLLPHRIRKKKIPRKLNYIKADVQ